MTDTKCTAPKCDCDWPVCRKERSIVAVNSSRSLTAENLKLRDLCERLELEAKIHAGEARGANSTIREAYRAVTNGTGEPGNWNGAKPVIEALTALRAECDALKTKLDEAYSVIAPFAGEHSSWGDTPDDERPLIEWLRSEVGGTFRPNWKRVYENTTHLPDRDNDLLLITRETARLAASAIAAMQTQDSYDNFQVALQEIRGVLK